MKAGDDWLMGVDASLQRMLYSAGVSFQVSPRCFTCFSKSDVLLVAENFFLLAQTLQRTTMFFAPDAPPTLLRFAPPLQTKSLETPVFKNGGL